MSQRRIGPPLLFALFLLAFVACLAWLGLSGWRPEPQEPQATADISGDNATAEAVSVEANATEEDSGERAYEEILDQPLEEASHQVDALLARALEEAGGDPDHLRLVDVMDVVDVIEPNPAGAVQSEANATAPHEDSSAELQPVLYHMQYMEAVLSQGIQDFVDILARDLARELPEASLMVLSPAPPEGNATDEFADRPQVVLRVSILGVLTHEVAVYSTHDPDRFGNRAPLPADAALLAIVIDDMGENMRFANDLALLDYPVTLSVWPRSTKAWETAQLAFESGLEVMVHQPMEPVDSHFRPGPGAVYTNMDAASIRREVAANIGRVPYAAGLNNHMGSRFTQDPAAVGAVMDVLAAERLFAVDSLTHPSSTVAEEAAKRDVPCVTRDVFLDVVQDVHAIMVQLDKAQQIALRRGSALAIGHPYPETLAALRQWGGRRDTRVRIVTVRALADRGRQQAAARENAAPEQAQ